MGIFSSPARIKKTNIQKLAEASNAVFGGLPFVNGQLDAPYNPQVLIDTKTQRYSNLFAILDEQINSSYLTYTGLEPYNTTSVELNRQQYKYELNGSYKHKGELYISKITMSGQINYQGRMTHGIPCPNTSDMTRLLDFDGYSVGREPQFTYSQLTVGKDLALLRSYSTVGDNYASRQSLYQQIAQDLGSLMSALSLNVDTSKLKYFIPVENDNQAKTLDRLCNSALKGSNPFVFMTQSLMSGIKNDIFTADGLMVDQYFNAIKNLLSLGNLFNGIDNAGVGNEKGERQITGELAGIQERTMLVAKTRLQLAEIWCEQTNRLFGTNVSVQLNKEERNDFYSTEVDNTTVDSRDNSTSEQSTAD